MAIDNDTSYELTGAQVKDLAQKIRNKADDNVFVGSSSSVAGSKGLVPAPSAGSQNLFLKGDGAWGYPEMVTDIFLTDALETRYTGQIVGFYAEPYWDTAVNLAQVKNALMGKATHLIYTDSSTGDHIYNLLLCNEFEDDNVTYYNFIVERPDGVKVKLTGAYNDNHATVDLIGGASGATTTFYINMLGPTSLTVNGATLFTDISMLTPFAGGVDDLRQLAQYSIIRIQWTYNGTVLATATASITADYTSQTSSPLLISGVAKPYNNTYEPPVAFYGALTNDPYSSTVLASISTTPVGGSTITVVQTTGSSTVSVMSQNAVTTALNNKNALIIREWL